ncbi:TPA: hypothetical protein ACV5H3_002010, partial [Neisseria meningitidis]
MIKDPSFPRRRESGLFGFSCFWVSGNFQIVIPAQAGIQTIGQRQYSKIIRKFEVLDSRFHGNDERLWESRPLDSGNIQRLSES